MSNTVFIYALCEPGTRTVRYIGKSSKPKARLKEHLRASVKFQNHLGHWLHSLITRSEKPNLVILREVPTEIWQEAERKYIRIARGLGMRLVNTTDGGDSPPVTPETRAKISAAHRGKKLSPDHRAKLSKAHRGKILTPEHRLKLIAGSRGRKPANFGKPLSEKARENLRILNSGKLHPQFGKAKSLETRAKISASLRGENHPNFGKRLPLETRLKMSAAASGENNPMFGRRKSYDKSSI